MHMIRFQDSVELVDKVKYDITKTIHPVTCTMLVDTSVHHDF